jgi:hypothetical protein
MPTSHQEVASVAYPSSAATFPFRLPPLDGPYVAKLSNCNPGIAGGRCGSSYTGLEKAFCREAVDARSLDSSAGV